MCLKHFFSFSYPNTPPVLRVCVAFAAREYLNCVTYREVPFNGYGEVKNFFKHTCTPSVFPARIKTRKTEAVEMRRGKSKLKRFHIHKTKMATTIAFFLFFFNYSFSLFFSRNYLHLLEIFFSTAYFDSILSLFSTTFRVKCDVSTRFVYFFSSDFMLFEWSINSLLSQEFFVFSLCALLKNV